MSCRIRSVRVDPRPSVVPFRKRRRRATNEEGDPRGSPSHNSPELVYFSFWTMALKASASLYAISASALRSRLMLCFFRLLMKTL